MLVLVEVYVFTYKLRYNVNFRYIYLYGQIVYRLINKLIQLIKFLSIYILNNYVGQDIQIYNETVGNQ